MKGFLPAILVATSLIPVSGATRAGTCPTGTTATISLRQNDADLRLRANCRNMVSRFDRVGEFGRYVSSLSTVCYQSKAVIKAQIETGGESANLNARTSTIWLNPDQDGLQAITRFHFSGKKQGDIFTLDTIFPDGTESLDILGGTHDFSGARGHGENFWTVTSPDFPPDPVIIHQLILCLSN